ncbi:uncharacterized protein TNIN_314851 [Trichonephila inaurata madagascariensis]|uniref:Uncharacterized protein n=1 Tax=Trichonephila inaurata madagascariensis TaxID=2747483 RepID=A0A8X7CMW8_9ARAC|nr:uncharacterized protein TNIN_314851 [Trichonephila inaurata madagascariensis]
MKYFIFEQLVRVFPESPDWLKEKGRYEEVGRIFEVIAQANGRELTPEYIINMKRRFRIEKSMQEERKRNGTETRYSVWDLFRGSNTCKKSTAIIFICGENYNNSIYDDGVVLSATCERERCAKRV